MYHRRISNHELRCAIVVAITLLDITPDSPVTAVNDVLQLIDVQTKAVLDAPH